LITESNQIRISTHLNPNSTLREKSVDETLKLCVLNTKNKPNNVYEPQGKNKPGNARVKAATKHMASYKITAR